MILKVLEQKSAKNFQNRKVTAYFKNSKIRLDISSLDDTENFLAMYEKRKPVEPSMVVDDLLNNGFVLANLGVSVALELSFSDGNKFAVFTKRGINKNCLALISGYWDASLDPSPEACAKRELMEEFLVFNQFNNKFLVPKGMKFPYEESQFTASECWTLVDNTGAIGWVSSAKIKLANFNNCRIYIDATTSSAQVVFGYYANFSNCQEVSILHAEDRPDKDNNLVTYLENSSIVLFKIVDNRLIYPGYYFEKGQLIPADLPNDTYFHPSMVGVNEFGIVTSDKIYLKDVIFSK